MSVHVDLRLRLRNKMYVELDKRERTPDTRYL